MRRSPMRLPHHQGTVDESAARRPVGRRAVARNCAALRRSAVRLSQSRGGNPSPGPPRGKVGEDPRGVLPPLYSARSRVTLMARARQARRHMPRLPGSSAPPPHRLTAAAASACGRRHRGTGCRPTRRCPPSPSARVARPASRGGFARSTNQPCAVGLARHLSRVGIRGLSQRIQAEIENFVWAAVLSDATNILRCRSLGFCNATPCDSLLSSK